MKQQNSPLTAVSFIGILLTLLGFHLLPFQATAEEESASDAALPAPESGRRRRGGRPRVEGAGEEGAQGAGEAGEGGSGDRGGGRGGKSR